MTYFSEMLIPFGWCRYYFGNQCTELNIAWILWQDSSIEPYALYLFGDYSSVIKWEVKVITFSTESNISLVLNTALLPEIKPKTSNTLTSLKVMYYISFVFLLLQTYRKIWAQPLRGLFWKLVTMVITHIHKLHALLISAYLVDLCFQKTAVIFSVFHSIGIVKWSIRT